MKQLDWKLYAATVANIYQALFVLCSKTEIADALNDLMEPVYLHTMQWPFATFQMIGEGMTAGFLDTPEKVDAWSGERNAFEPHQRQKLVDEFEQEIRELRHIANLPTQKLAFEATFGHAGNMRNEKLYYFWDPPQPEHLQALETNLYKIRDEIARLQTDRVKLQAALQLLATNLKTYFTFGPTPSPFISILEKYLQEES